MIKTDVVALVYWIKKEYTMRNIQYVMLGIIAAICNNPGRE
jgi:hypothetical protein